MPSLLVTGASQAQPANTQASQQETKATKKKRISYLPETNVPTYLRANIYNFTTIFFFNLFLCRVSLCDHPSNFLPITSCNLLETHHRPPLPAPPSRGKGWSYTSLSFLNQLCHPDVSFLHIPGRRKNVTIIYW